MEGNKDRKHFLSGGSANPRDAKRAKLRSARTIMANNQEPALRDGRLDVPDFLAARKYEIQQMERAMQNSRQAAKQRAFQSLPRVLRRRTASHNVKRIPKRLRKRAEREMADDKTPALAKKNKKLRAYARVKQLALERRLQRAAGNKITKLNPSIVYNRAGVNELANPPPGKAKFQHRQKDKKIWLPTHVWHAKRAHLETRWGFSVVKKPTQKAYRPTHRASNLAGAVAWDKSYVSTLILEESTANNGVLQKVICKLTNNEKTPAVSDRYTTGGRSWQGLLFDEKCNILGPGLIYWSKRPSDDASRRVLVRAHPAMFKAIFAFFQLLQKESEKEEFTIYDCRFTIGSIDITGPASLPALASVLKLQDDDDHKLSKLWKTLGSISNTESLPKNVVVTLDAKDPRFSYPPQPVRKVRSEDELVELITGWPENEQLLVKESALFTPDTLNESYKNQCSQKLVERRKRAAGPGQPVKTSSDDPKIPVILFKNTNNSWTVLLPWGWVLPVWHSLLHLNDVHIGGVEQEHQIAFESGRLYFPDDYPGTPAGVAAEFENSKERKDTWIRKPASKRVSYSRIKIREGKDMKRGEEGSPFKCDWKFLARVVKNAESDAAVEIEEDITAEHILEELKQVNEKETAVKPATHRLKSNKSVYECPVLPSYVRFQNVLAKSGSELETETGVDKLEIIPVRLNFVQRGSPSAPAHIYRLPEGFDIAKHKKHNKITDDKIVCPPTNHLIGFVTTGTYNLMEGNGSAVGSILATSKGQYCLVRNVGSATTRLAKWEKITL